MNCDIFANLHFLQTSSTPDVVEITLWLCVVSRILIELDQVLQQGIYRYATFWNFVDVLTSLLMLAAAVLKITVCITTDEDASLSDTEKVELRDLIMYNTYLYAYAEFFLIIRWLNILEVTTDLGPMLIAMKYMLVDVLKFVFVLLATCVVGAFVAVYSITNNIKQLDLKLIDNPNISQVTIPSEFDRLDRTFINLIWSTFGLLEMPVGLRQHNYCI